ncbi:MAG TPA: hypothetical protein VGK62_03750 [Gaiellaceae bacterium]
MTKRDTTLEKPTAAGMEAFLAEFSELKRFFAGTSALSRAIGVSRDTILAWDKGDTSRVRAKNRVRVRQLRVVCEAATEHLPEDAQIGVWMEAPQTFLYGGTPVQFLNDGGDTRFLIQSMAPPVAELDLEGLAALGASEDDLALLVPESRRRDASSAAQARSQAPTEERVVDLMEALRRSVEDAELAKALRGRRSRPRVVTLQDPEGGWATVVEGPLLAGHWRRKRQAEREGARLAACTGAAHETIERESVARKVAAGFGRKR